MPTKTISITKKAYDKLLLEKKDGESFSDVILKLTSERKKLSDFFGKWKMTDEKAKKFEKELEEMWRMWDEGS
ncbi:MAG: antitoxin VapB family protein [Candidatus Methanofastidiosia archaeon]